MFWIVLLMLVLGFLLILLEAVLPGGISMAGGFLLIGAALFLSWRDDPNTSFLLMFISIPLATFIAYWMLRKGVGALALEPNRSPGAQSGAPADAPAVGEVLRVCQPLHPTGAVEWGRRRLAARSLSPEVESPAGAWVRVRGADSIFLLVEPAPAPEPSGTPAPPTAGAAPGDPPAHPPAHPPEGEVR